MGSKTREGSVQLPKLANKARPVATAERSKPMRFLHTMLRVRDLDAALKFYVDLLGLKEVRRRVDEKNRYTLVFLAAPEDAGAAAELLKAGRRDAPCVELTYNWDTE